MAMRELVHLQNDGADADDLRRLIATLSGDGEGVVEPGDLLVSEKSGTPNMSVDVAAGRLIVKGTENAFQGSYFGENDAVDNVTITAADPTNPRKDLIVVKGRDTVYSGADDDGVIVVEPGTPAASPVEPSLPDNALKLAVVDVAALATSIVDANITDTRSIWARDARFLANDDNVKPQQALQSSDLTLTGTDTDIPGCTITVTTPRDSMIYVISGTWQQTWDGSVATTGTIIVELHLDGVKETPVWLVDEDNGPVVGQGSFLWVVPVAVAGSHTFKLKAWKSGSTGAMDIINDDNGTAISILHAYG